MANFDINALSTAIVTDNKWQVPVKIQRNHANPLDQTTLFFSKSDAETYAAGSLTKEVNGTTTTFNNAYPGQFIAVIENSKVTGYIIGVDKTLIELGSAASTGNVANDLTALNAKLDGFITDNFNPLKTKVDGIEPIVSKLSGDANTDGSIANIKKLISDEATTRATNDSALSDDYVKKIGAASDKLSGEISSVNNALTSEVQRATAAEKTLSDAIATLNGTEDVNGSVKKTVKTAINNLVNGAPEAYDTLKEIADYISSDKTGASEMTAHLSRLDTKTDTISTDLDNLEAAYSTFTGTTYANKMSELDKGATALSGRMTTAEGKIDGLTTITTDHESRLTAEVQRAISAEAALKTSIDNKVLVDGISATTLNVKHVSQDEYHTIVKSENGADPNTIYVVSSDTLNMYDQKIINVKDGTDAKDAVNVGQLSAVSADLQGKITNAVNSGVNKLSGEIFTPTTGLKDVLEQKIATETQARETADQTLSNALTAETNRATTAENGLADRLTTLETTTVPNAIISANGYTDTVSAALSDDYVKKIGAEKSRAEGVEKALSGRLSVIEGSGEGSVTKALADAKSYANDISTALSTDYTGKIDALETTLTGSYVLKSVAESASADDKLVKASTVDNKITAAIDALDVTKLPLTQAESISSIEEVDGKIVVGKQAIQITTNQVTGLDTALNARVLTANAEDATSNDKLVKRTTVNTRINNAVAAISVDTTTIPASKTLATYKQENGKVAYTTQDIQIAESQVTDLTTHLNNKLELTAFNAYKNEVGLSAASSTNVVVTKADIAGLVGAMHFIGVKASTNDVENPKAGDIVIVGAKEYVYCGDPAEWHELGDEGIYLTKAEFESWKTSTYDVKMSAIDLSVDNLSGALSTEAKTRADNDTVLSNAITAINDWKDTTLETRLTGIEKDITDEVAARTAITNALSDVNNTWKASVDSNLTSINQTIANNKTAIDKALTDEIARATAAEKAVDDRVTELSTYTHALSASQLVWDIDIINCGGAI